MKRFMLLAVIIMIAPTLTPAEKTPVATKAMKENIRPFPDGSVMAKVACSTTKHPKFPVVTVP
jgi:hypothetical protein